MEDGERVGQKTPEDEAHLREPSTLQWPGDRQTGGQTGGQVCGRRGNGDRMSLRSDLSSREASSWTESQGELKGSRGKGPGREAGLNGAGLDPGENRLPEEAAKVFGPPESIVSCPSSPKHNEVFWEMGSEKSPFLGPRGLDYNQHGYQYEYPETPPPAKCDCCAGRDALKMGVSFMTSALLFPFLVWGGYVFLPFDAPLLQGAPSRLVYTLRCSVFAAAPIIFGWIVVGLSRLRTGVTKPFFADDITQPAVQDVVVHRRFVSDSASLFLVYFLQLVVMAMYLSQDQLKMVPLLTILFAFGRLAYWVAAAYRSSIRAFGFGLCFLPSLAMMVANFYFIFTVDAASSIFSVPPMAEEAPPTSGRQRFWG